MAAFCKERERERERGSEGEEDKEILDERVRRGEREIAFARLAPKKRLIFDLETSFIWGSMRTLYLCVPILY